jgi:2-C-methyl-D-erythritol 4-phosphate cytidylyltransferase
VRPLVSDRIINDVVKALKTCNAVGVAIATTDTIITTDLSGKWVKEIPDRHCLQRMQTPQGFKLSTITKAYQIALQDPKFIATDDCGVVSRYLPEEPIFIVKGEKTNIKITYPEDVILLEHLLQ